MVICELQRADDTQLNSIKCIQESTDACCANHKAPLARLEVTERLCLIVVPREVVVMVPVKLSYCISISEEKQCEFGKSGRDEKCCLEMERENGIIIPIKSVLFFLVISHFKWNGFCI